MWVRYPVIVPNVLTLPRKQQRKAATLSTLSAGALPPSINGLNSMPYLEPATTGANIQASHIGGPQALLKRVSHGIVSPGA